MRKLTIYLFLVVTLTYAGCDFLDPTEVDNPNLTEESFLDSANSLSAWLPGVERQMSITLNEVITIAMLVSDNYFNNRTISCKVCDILNLQPTDPDIALFQQNLFALRNGADFGLTELVPIDPDATSDQIAELYFYRGMGHLMMGEYLVAAPAGPRTEAFEPDAHYTLAIADFQEAIDRTSDAEIRIGYQLAQARAYYNLGDATQASTVALDVINGNNAYVRYAQFEDDSDGPVNVIESFISQLSTDEFQPLPRLDFLDPKYYFRGPTEESPIAFLKSEEAYFILAEAALAAGDLAGAQTRMTEVLDVIAARPTAMVDETVEDRGRGNLVVYPNTEATMVQASPSEEPVAGLVRTRGEGSAPVEVPIVSGTSITTADIAALASVDEAVELLYLMRQQVFMAEGRRMIDMGIKLPIVELEANDNPNIEAGSAFFTARIPSFMPPGEEIDAFTLDETQNLVVIQHNINTLIMMNRTSDEVVPFF